MNTLFFTVEGNNGSGWDVVKKTYPESLGDDRLRMAVVSEPLEHYEDKKVAEVAGKKNG